MTDTPISARQFIACLKQQVPVSSQIKAANQLDVSSLSENEQKQILDALRVFAGTKNGPMLIMGLPGPLQALLSFSGTVMPGQDRLAYLKATPCQALVRLARHDDRRLLESYPFEKASKSDWACYLSKATKLIDPCKKFLCRAESSGGFTNAELIALARKCPLVIPWIDPGNTPFVDAYELYVGGNADALWKKCPFSSLKKDEWLIILSNGKIAIPSAFTAAVESEMFSVSELLDLAGHNHRIYPFIPLDKVGQISLVSHLLKYEATFLWQNYDFKRLNANSWERLICERKIGGIVPHVELLLHAKGLSNLIVGRILEHDDRYINYVPFSLVSKEKQISLLVTGKYESLWQKCDFSVFEKADWRLLFSKTSKVPPAFKVAVEKNLFSLPELCNYARYNENFVQFLPVASIDAETLTDLLVRSKSDYLWTSESLKRLNADQWVELIKNRKPLVPGKFLQHLRNAKILSSRHVTEILDVDYRYYTYVPLELIPTDRIIKYLLSGNAKDLWQSYPFDLFKDDDWFCLLEQPDSLVPDAGKLFLANKSGSVNVDKLNLLLAKRMELIEYMRPEDIDPKLAVVFLTQHPDSHLWKSYDFYRFTDAQIQTIVIKSSDRDCWPEAIVSRFSDAKDSLPDEVILSIAEGLSLSDGNIANVVELLSVTRIHKSGVGFFERICKHIPQVKEAQATAIRKLTLGDKPWQKLRQEFLIALLTAFPVSRKFIMWQDYELSIIDKLASTNHAYEEELSAGRKFKLFVWRHWLLLSILLIAASCIAFVTAKALYAAAQERAIAERKQNIALRINELWRRGEFHQLQQYVDSLERTEDVDVLQNNMVANSLGRLADWKTKRDCLDRDLKRLEALSASNWQDESLDESARIFDRLKTNDSAEANETALIQKFYSGYSLRAAEVARVKRNERLASKISEITDDCSTCSSIESLIGMIAELTQISEIADISETNMVSCSAATSLAKARINDLYKSTLAAQREIIVKADVESVLTESLEAVGLIRSSNCVSDENGSEADALSALAKEKISKIRAAEAARLAAEKEKREKREVEAISQKVAAITAQLNSVDNSFNDKSFIKIRAELNALSECPSYDRFRNENPQAIPALTSRLEEYENGIASAGELGRKCADLENGITNHVLSSKEYELCNDLIRQLDAWIGKYASTISWNCKAIESHKAKITSLVDESNDVKTLIEKANGASDYKTLSEAIKTIFEKYSRFAECQEIDPAKMLSDGQVMSVVENKGLFSAKRLFEFVGLIQINPRTKGSIVPLINNSVTSATYIYYITSASDSEGGKKRLKVKKIFERTPDGIIRMISGIDYSRCQGVGLFVSADPSYVDPDSWTPGMTNPAFPHWVASSTYGEWFPEPGYVKTSSFGDALSELEWSPYKTYISGKARSGKRPGEWQVKVVCYSCKGGGQIHHYNYRSEACKTCNGFGYLWKHLQDDDEISSIRSTVINSILEGDN